LASTACQCGVLSTLCDPISISISAAANAVLIFEQLRNLDAHELRSACEPRARSYLNAALG